MQGGDKLTLSLGSSSNHSESDSNAVACESVADSVAGSGVTCTHLVKEPPKSILSKPPTPLTKRNCSPTTVNATTVTIKNSSNVSNPVSKTLTDSNSQQTDNSTDIFSANPFNPFASSLIGNPFGLPLSNPTLQSANNNTVNNPFSLPPTSTTNANPFLIPKNPSPPYSPKDDRPATPKSLTSLDSAHGGSIASSATPENSPVPPNDKVS